MGSKLYRTIGWGMPWADFRQCQRVSRDGNDIEEALYDLFDATTPEELTVPETVRKASFTRPGNSASRILDPHLLASTFTIPGETPTAYEPARSLYAVPGNMDHSTLIVFFPNAHQAKKWKHCDDDVDYAFEIWRDGNTPPAMVEPRDVTVWPPIGFYPWNDSFMHADGTPLLPGPDGERDENAIPSIPAEIRWYVAKLGILDDADILRLRPIMAQWWT